jgi:hypothetical protein
MQVVPFGGYPRERQEWRKWGHETGKGEEREITKQVMCVTWSSHS